MLYKVLHLLHKIYPAKDVYAHCDIPCGIYDPHLAQVAAHSVIRMTELIEKLPEDMPPTLETRNSFVRYIQVKEEHAELCKKEVRILWGDYFKPEHVEQYPELHELVWSIMKAASKTKQEVNMQAAEELLEHVQKFAEIFWKTKGAEPVRQKSLYPTEREIVYPKM